MLDTHLKLDELNRVGSLTTNLELTLPPRQSSLAQQILKAVEFIPEFAGKLSFYLSIVNNFLAQRMDNPTIGLMIC